MVYDSYGVFVLPTECRPIKKYIAKNGIKVNL